MYFQQGTKPEVTKQKRKFSSFFRSLVIELDKDLYGPDNHLVEVCHFQNLPHSVEKFTLFRGLRRHGDIVFTIVLAPLANLPT